MTNSHPAFKVTANDFVFYFDKKEIENASIIQRSPTSFNCLQDNRSVNAVLMESDTTNKKFKISIGGETFLVNIKDELDQMLDQMGFGVKAGKQLTSIKAPMPGLVLEIDVTEGQSLNAGDKVLILEAMKMENSIMIPGSATVKKILVKKGQAVDRGQVMIELE